MMNMDGEPKNEPPLSTTMEEDKTISLNSRTTDRSNTLTVHDHTSRILKDEEVVDRSPSMDSCQTLHSPPDNATNANELEESLPDLIEFTSVSGGIQCTSPANIEEDSISSKKATPPLTSDSGTEIMSLNVEKTNWSNLLQWIQCMCVVTFDLNLGQVLEYVYPPELQLSEPETTNLCYLAFPDSNSSCMGDTRFHVRFRINPDRSPRLEEESQDENWSNYSRNCPIGMKVDDSHYWGFVYFRQKRDSLLPRGYFQKSFIIVTRLPFLNLFYEMVIELANKYFLNGEQVLKEACLQINEQWPRLQVGRELNLPLFDDIVYRISIPSVINRKSASSSNLSTSMAELNLNERRRHKCMMIPSVIELELFHSLGFILKHLYTLWELVLTAEPMVIIGTSPADCSQMVQSMVALIAPLEYCAEYRPYFTIHDSEFKEFTREYGRIPPSVMLGVTNPFFIKLLKDWPHLLRLPDTEQILSLKCYRHSKMKAFTTSASSSSSLLLDGQTKTKGQPGINRMSMSSSSSIFNSNAGMVVGGNGESNGGGAPGLYTKYKSYLKRDKVLIKKILMGVSTKRPDHVQTALIRRHLLELTQSFMIPLERYVASLMPLQKDISPFKAAPNAHNFKLDDFLATLELAGPELTSPLKGDWKGLYRRFFHSPNFRGWYNNRHKALQCTLQERQLQALSEVNLEKWAMEKHEVEIIDMILNLKQKLQNCGNITDKTMEQIKAQITSMKNLLPNDLKDVANI